MAAASAEVKCQLMAIGLDEALPRCPLTDADRVLTLLHVGQEPQHPLRPTWVGLVLDRDVEPMVVPQTPWRELLPRLEGPLWLRVEP